MGQCRQEETQGLPVVPLGLQEPGQPHHQVGQHRREFRFQSPPGRLQEILPGFRKGVQPARDIPFSGEHEGLAMDIAGFLEVLQAALE
jgi:hypothetical protein